MPVEFKERVTVLFQENNSDKMFAALHRLGFAKFRKLPHRRRIKLNESTEIYCYQQGQMNSALAVLSGGKTIVNINDAELNSKDCSIIFKDIGRCHTLLNQFSFAGYSGRKERDEYIPSLAKRVLENMSDNHRDLAAEVTTRLFHLRRERGGES